MSSNIGPVTHQPTGFDNLAIRIGRGNPIARRERSKLNTPADEERVGANEKCVGPVAHEGSEGRLDLAAGAGVEDLNLQSDGACRFRYLSQRGLGDGSIGRINQHGDTNRLGHQLVQQTQPLDLDLGGKKLMPVALPPGRARLATRPNLTGSSPTPKTIGIVVVAALAASAAMLQAGVAITATRRRTKSAINDGRRSYWPSSQWYSTITFWPSM